MYTVLYLFLTRRSSDLSETGLQTLYFGGGTPSLLPVDALAALLTSLRDAFHERSSHDDLEVTLEANPEDVTDERSEEQTTELQTLTNIVCRLLTEIRMV